MRMDWGLVALIVTANAVTGGLLVAGGLWYLHRHLLPALVRSAPRARRRAAEADHAVDAPAAVRRTRRQAPVREPAREPEARPPGRRRGLKGFLAPVGGAPGTITDDQRAGVEDLLGEAAPTRWMSSAQAHTLLCARDYAEAVIDRRRGTRSGLPGRHRIVRRLTLAILADDRARGFVVDWAEGRFAGDDTGVPDPLEQEVWVWVQRQAARLMEAEGRLVDAA
jgi:hypothetical protein